MQSLHLNRPYAMMMVGIPGSGKSQFALKFAETFSTPYIDSLMLETNAADDKAASELIGLVLGELVKTEKSFVFEGNSDTRIRRTEFAAWARSKGYTPLFIWVQTDVSTSLERTLRARSMTREEFAQSVKNFSPPHESEKPIVVSGKHTYATQAKVVLKRLGEMNRSSPQAAAARTNTTSSRTRSVPIR